MKRMKYFLNQILCNIFCFLLSCDTFATPIIPVSSNDETAAGSDFAQTVVTIFQTDIIPIVMIGGAVWVIWTGIGAMANGIKEAQERQKFDPLKNAIIKTVIVVVVGGALLYLLDQVRSYSF